MSAEGCTLFSVAEKSNTKLQTRGEGALVVSITPSVSSNMLPRVITHLQTDQWDLIVTYLYLCKETNSEAYREEKKKI